MNDADTGAAQDIQACTEIFPEEFELALQKNAETISLESACFGDTMYCNGCHDFCKKRND